MDTKEHIERHKVLHRMLDELVGDWIMCGEGTTRLPSKFSIMDLMEWSNQQTMNPEEPKQ